MKTLVAIKPVLVDASGRIAAHLAWAESNAHGFDLPQEVASLVNSV